MAILIGLNAIVLFIHMTIWFIDSVNHKNYGLVDIAWGLNFVLVAMFSFIYTSSFSILSILMLTLVSIWGLRLSFHLWVRNRGKDEDFRYVAMRKNFGKHPNFQAYFKVFMFQGLLALLISLPIQASFLVPTQNSMTGYIILGLGVLFYAIGFLFEALGDYQLKVFKRDPKNKGKIMDKGLWSLTRHPNYFGDFMIWFGYSVMMLSSINMNYLYTVIGFLIMAFLLRFVSGVPLLEKKYKDNALYQAYAKKTPIFFPKLFK